MTRMTLVLTAALTVSIGTAVAAPKSYDMPGPTASLRAPKAGARGDGFEAAQANCLVCHSVDYIAIQPPGKGAAFWESEVQKMIKVYRAPIDEGQARAIATYLADTY